MPDITVKLTADFESRAACEERVIGLYRMADSLQHANIVSVRCVEKE